MRTVFVKAGRAKPLWSGHPWVFADSVARVDAGAPDEDWVRVVDEEGRALGRGFLSEGSAIRVRLVTREDAHEDPLVPLREALDRAVSLRARLLPADGDTDAYRLVHGEGDGVPGLVVDRFADVLVAQFGIHATHARREAIADHLLERTGARTLVSRPAGYEDVEGIADPEPWVRGATPPAVVPIREAGLRLEVAPLHGQKTGHYVDQRENRLRVGEIARGLEVLDLYAGTGGFSLQCLRHGARRAVAVESSPRAADALRRHAALNDVVGHLEVRHEDATAVLATLRAEKRHFDLVVADPPNFFPRRGATRGALKAHRELAVRALARVAAGGFLASFTCSARLDAAAFLEMHRSAARECRRSFRVLRELGAGPDHPVAGGLPEGRYLAGLLLQVDPGTPARPSPEPRG